MRMRKDASLRLLQDIVAKFGEWGLGPDRELDCRIAFALGYDWDDPDSDETWRDHVEKHGYTAAWLTDHVYGKGEGVPEFTRSFDAVWKMLFELMPGTDHITINVEGPGSGAKVGTWVLGRPEADGGPYVGFKADTHHYDPVFAFLEAVLKSYMLRLEKAGGKLP